MVWFETQEDSGKHRDPGVGPGAPLELVATTPEGAGSELEQAGAWDMATVLPVASQALEGTFTILCPVSLQTPLLMCAGHAHSVHSSLTKRTGDLEERKSWTPGYHRFRHRVPPCQVTAHVLCPWTCGPLPIAGKCVWSVHGGKWRTSWLWQELRALGARET